MEKYLNKIETGTYYYMTVGNAKKPFIHPTLLVPRRAAVDKHGVMVMSKDNYPKTYILGDEQVQEEVVRTWSSSATPLSQLQQPEKNCINAIKGFLNTDDWRCLVVFHDKECLVRDVPSYGNHIHVIIYSDVKQLSKHNTYRSMSRQVNTNGGYCSLNLIRDDVWSFVKYLIQDDEKVFLGANSEALLKLYTDCENNVGMIKSWVLEDAEEPSTKRKRSDVSWAYADEQLSSGSAPDPDMDQYESIIPVPSSLKKDTSGKSVKFITDMLKANPKCRDIESLISSQIPYSEAWNALVHLGATASGKQQFLIALNMLVKEASRKTPAEAIMELPDDIPDYMNVRQSQAVFNAWCVEQNISPAKYACMMQMLLKGKGQKRIGVILSGYSNSGKTVMTNNMFICLKDMIGRITRDAFPFQVCGGKKIIIGEEIGFTPVNIERYKDLMSGAPVSCDRKGTTPIECQPMLILMNSNADYKSQLDTKQIQQMKVRLYAYGNLKPSKLLKKITGHLHPRLFFEQVKEYGEYEFEALKMDRNIPQWNMNPIGYGEQFTGEWTEMETEYQEDTEEEKEIREKMCTQYQPEWDPEPIVCDEDVVAVEEMETGVRKVPAMAVDPNYKAGYAGTAEPHVYDAARLTEEYGSVAAFEEMCKTDRMEAEWRRKESLKYGDYVTDPATGQEVFIRHAKQVMEERMKKSQPDEDGLVFDSDDNKENIPPKQESQKKKRARAKKEGAVSKPLGKKKPRRIEFVTLEEDTMPLPTKVDKITVPI